MIRFAGFFFLFLASFGLYAQVDPRQEIATLCSEQFSGRGYVNNGQQKAASYVAKQFEEAGLSPLGKSYFQPLTMQVNTFPSEMMLQVDSKKLVPGTDFLVKATSSSVKGSFEIFLVTLKHLENEEEWKALQLMNFSRSVVVLDTMTFEGEETGKRYKKVQFNGLFARAVIIKTAKKMMWTVGREQGAYATFEVQASAWPGDAKVVKLSVKAKLIADYKLNNVAAMVKGTSVPDSFLVVTAHYDHLGMMGNKTMFPGAHDNASGTAMMLQLARYYAKNPHRYSIVFIAFAAEEAGLVGSKYFVEHPLIPLKSIRFLMNLDLEGSGSDGITVVNATEYPAEFTILQDINKEHSYLKQVASRGKAANSDHYWFSENGVPSFFIYQMGNYSHYHDPGDKAEDLPLTHFQKTADLVKFFFSAL